MTNNAALVKMRRILTGSRCVTGLKGEKDYSKDKGMGFQNRHIQVGMDMLAGKSTE